MLPLAKLYDDFAERDFHKWLHQTHNAHALHRQFPEYTLDTLYRVRKGHKAKYMPERVFLTLKGILEFAEHHRREASKLSFYNLAHKYGVSECTITRIHAMYKQGITP